jgi:hypothetical protein
VDDLAWQTAEEVTTPTSPPGCRTSCSAISLVERAMDPLLGGDLIGQIERRHICGAIYKGSMFSFDHVHFTRFEFEGVAGEFHCQLSIRHSPHR